MSSKSNKPTYVRIDGADGLEVKQTYWNGKRYTRISPIRIASSQTTEPDLLDLLGELSKGARDLFLTVKKNMDYRTHMAVLPNQELSRSQINKRTAAIQELEIAGTGMACRVPTTGITNAAEIEQKFRPSTFMLSPAYIFARTAYEEEIEHIWPQCISRSKARSKKLEQDRKSQLAQQGKTSGLLTTNTHAKKPRTSRPTNSLFSR